MCLKKNWIVCSKYDNHYRLNNEHTWRWGTYMTNLITMEIFTLLMNKMFIWALEVIRKRYYNLYLDMLTKLN